MVVGSAWLVLLMCMKKDKVERENREPRAVVQYYRVWWFGVKRSEPRDPQSGSTLINCGNLVVFSIVESPALLYFLLNPWTQVLQSKGWYNIRQGSVLWYPLAQYPHCRALAATLDQPHHHRLTLESIHPCALDYHTSPIYSFVGP